MAAMSASPAVSIPRLETPRLRLREYRMSDFNGFAAHEADETTTDVRGGCDRRSAFRIFGCQAALSGQCATIAATAA
jgi:hypothetical protein